MRNIIIAVVLVVFVVVPLAFHKFGDNKQENMKHMAYIANGFRFVAAAKTGINEYYSVEGKYPETNADIHIPDPEEFGSQAVKSLEVKDGVIILTFNELSGVDDGVVMFSPETRSNGYFMDWKCETPSYSFITEFAPQCKYVGT